MVILDLLKIVFSVQVTPAHIKWDWDSGHAYCYIDHPLARLSFPNAQLDDEWTQYCNDWMYENQSPTPLCKGCGGSCDQE